ncbi:type I restriction enzyme HsdR N-terminal domain-containing protein, partial [Pseudomonadota bacterium]
MTDNAQTPKIHAIEDGMMLDYLSNEPIKQTPKELVRQRTVRALFHEYGIDVNDMALDLTVKVEGRKKKIDVAIFNHGEEHVVENIRRIVMCDKEPKQGRKSTIKMRDHDQAKRDLSLMEA